MPFTARELITKAYYLSGVVSRDFESVSGSQITDGLNLLNEVLAVKGMTGSLIPYFKEYEFNAVVGQEEYFIPGLMQLETLTFNIDSVRYSMQSKGRVTYFGKPRADNVQSLPYEFHVERTLNGANLYVYFLPNLAYPMKIWGKFKLDEITDLCEDLLLTYDQYFLKYLTYALASDICEEYQVMLPPQAAKALQVYEEKMTLISPLDLSTKKRSSFHKCYSVNYAYANLGRGWTP